ncbi:hypothetical protein PTQ21_18675 [Paenibacillus marchantiae]|uniref:hypothetical protein n=1 Tax=Paenibacillus marchantiae TaxID=3026433 RepID=UPI00237A59FA|nr:hypothetical protein [Paenibacillus marchantiae]WDQ30464.1 hypothetical protein PTQ21_18675 [Paenibacillus marchantiae]
MSKEQNYEDSNNIDPSSAKKPRLVDIVGILSRSIPVEIQEQTKDKTFDQIREEAIIKHFQEQYEKHNSSLEKDNETN